MLDPAALFLDQAAQSPHVYFVYDVQAQRVTFVNAAYELVLRGQREQVNEELPALLARLPPADLPLLQRYWRLWQKGSLQDEIEVRLRRPDGPDQWLCLTPHWHQDAAGQVFVSGSLRDTTLDKEHRQYSEKFNAKKNTVLEILAHDLAGAFVLLQQLAEYVQEEMGTPANAKIPEMLALMRQTSQKSVAMIHDLVDQEFLETAAIPLKRERVDLGQQVKLSLEPFWRAPSYAARRVRYEAPPVPVYAEVDVIKLLQVVSNLVTNALKFTPDEGSITVRLEAHPAGVRILVIDEGIGIPAALQAQLFERFTPARRPGLRGEPTKGLGLSLCRTIVALHQGTLAVSSTEGQGATFTIELPRLPAAPT
ncbi:MAG: hypothetical protein EOO59_00365 [Hymenobacter sp.]|nr:MAG: hypothetical protein EOO59_00365 [Hymenobacter sp.]